MPVLLVASPGGIKSFRFIGLSYISFCLLRCTFQWVYCNLQRDVFSWKCLFWNFRIHT